VIPPGFVHDLLARTDIVEVVGRHVELKKAGINHKGLCPFHGEKTPSFTVSPSRQTYHCFGCGVHGNAIGFLMEHTGAGFVEAVEDLAQRVGMVVPQDERSSEERERAKAQKARQITLTDVLARAGDHYRAQLKKTPRAVEYLKRRGLTGQIAKHFGLGYAPEGWRTLASAFPAYDDPLLVEAGLVITPEASDAQEQKRYDRFRDRVMFPIRNVQGETIGFGGRVLDRGEPKYLNSPETPVFHKGRELYGLFEGRTGIRQRGYALVVEGYMDVVALAQHGFENAVATLGTACTAEHVQKLFRFTDSVVFSFDGDAAGRRAAGRALEAALPHATEQRTIRFLFLPTEHDPDSYVRDLGAEAFERAVEAAMPLSRQLLQVSSEGCDLAGPEGRARMLATARPLWSLLPDDGLLKRQILGELARAAQLPEEELRALWSGQPTRPEGVRPPAADSTRRPGRAGPPQRAAAPRGARRSPAKAADHAVRLLLQHNELWADLSTEEHALLHELPGGHGDLVAWLERHLLHHGPSPWAVVEAGLAADGLVEPFQALLRPTVGLAEETQPLADLRASLRLLESDRLEQAAAEIVRVAQPSSAQLQELSRLKRRLAELKASRLPPTVES
jgi:DNA primase